VVIIENRDKPGGHWNSAYKYVKLHQPAYCYGVSSTPIPGSENIRELASGPKLIEYWKKIAEQLEATGNVRIYYEHSYDFKQTPEAKSHKFESKCGS
jgi:cation diffusion facilitator CzcD-associated flavoprotein CzcO